MGWFQSWLGAGCGWYVPFGISSWDGSSLGLGLAAAGTFPLAFPHEIVKGFSLMVTAAGTFPLAFPHEIVKGFSLMLAAAGTYPLAFPHEIVKGFSLRKTCPAMHGSKPYISSTGKSET